MKELTQNNLKFNLCDLMGFKGKYQVTHLQLECAVYEELQRITIRTAWRQNAVRDMSLPTLVRAEEAAKLSRDLERYHAIKTHQYTQRYIFKS